MIAGQQGKREIAATLFGAAASLREKMHCPKPPYETLTYGECLAKVADLKNEFEQGRQMQMDDVVHLALSE
ncbi:MAG: hypothetical protein HW412_943 [Bacteroidetes bacterium]|nr:hypothetical protein [Bacteroidota bacterium]